MHAKWNSERVSQEWFDFDAAQLAQVKLDIVDFENQHGANIERLERCIMLALPQAITPALLQHKSHRPRYGETRPTRFVRT